MSEIPVKSEVVETDAVKANEAPALEETLVFKPEKKKKFWPIIRKIIFWGVIAAIVGGIGYAVYTLFFKEEEVVMQTAFSYYTTIESDITGSGSATSKKTQDIAGLAEGVVTEVLVSAGDFVNVGDPIFVVDDQEIADSLTTSSETLTRRQEDLQALYDEQAGQAGRAEFTGKVLNVSDEMEVGDIINKGDVLATIVDDTKMRLTTYFSTAYKDIITVGMPVSVSIPSNMALVPGTVDYVANNTKITTEGAVLFEVEIILDNPGALTEGLLATAVVHADMGDVTPAEAGKLEYNRKENVKADTSGELVELEMSDFYNFNEGDVMFRILNEDIASEISDSLKELEAAQESHNDLLDDYKYYRPTAEISGQVISVGVEVGDELTGSSGSIVQIADMSTMVIEANIDELDIAKLTVGMPVEVTADSTGMMYEGEIVEIQMQGKVENGMSTFPIKIEIPNPSFNMGDMGDMGGMDGMDGMGGMDGMDGIFPEGDMMLPEGEVVMPEDGTMPEVGVDDSTAVMPEDDVIVDDSAAVMPEGNADIMITEEPAVATTSDAPVATSENVVGVGSGISMSYAYEESVSVGGGTGVFGGASGDLYPGMWLNFRILLSRAENILAVPSNAVKYVENGTIVFVRETDENSVLAEDIDMTIVPEGFTAVYVTVGTSDATQIEIVDGLSENAEVATTSASDDFYGGYYY